MIIVTCFTAVTACTAPPEIRRRTGAVMNGWVEHGYPNVGQLTMGCSGSLIDADTVLTAAHCLTQLTQWDVAWIRFDLDDGTSKQAAAFDYHALYDSETADYDIGVVHLEAPITHISPVTLSSRSLNGGEPITIVGFGLTDMHTENFGVKHATTNTIATVNENSYEYILDSSSVGMACRGDSGGPIFTRAFGEEMQIGITSRGTLCDTSPTAPTGYSLDVRVDTFIDWIRERQDAGGSTGSGTTAPTLPTNPILPFGEVKPTLDVITDIGPNMTPNFTFGFAINTPYITKSVVVYLDQVLQARYDGLKSVNHPIVGASPGFHWLRVLVTDEWGHTSQTDVPFAVADRSTSPLPVTGLETNNSQPQSTGSQNGGCMTGGAHAPYDPIATLLVLLVLIRRRATYD